MTDPDANSSPAVSTLTLDFLAWVECRSRTYAESMEVWQSHCPRHTIWEDALSDGLVTVARGSGAPRQPAAVRLTLRGQAILDGRWPGFAGDNGAV